MPKIHYNFMSMHPLSLNIEQLTSPEIRTLIDAGYTTILVPLGATEQHGPAIPLLMDADHGMETCLRAAKKLGNCLVGPNMHLGYSPQHTAFAGTVSMSKATLRGIIHDIAESHARSGFTCVYFWISHAENDAILQAVLPELVNKWADCHVCGLKSLADYGAATWAVMGAENDVAPEVSGSHAGEIETSMLLATRPELVRMEVAEAGNPAPFSDLCEQMMSEGMESVSPNGVLGDQRGGDAKRGQRYLDRLAGYLATEVSDIRNSLEKAPNGK